MKSRKCEIFSVVLLHVDMIGLIVGGSLWVFLSE